MCYTRSVREGRLEDKYTMSEAAKRPEQPGRAESPIDTRPEGVEIGLPKFSAEGISTVASPSVEQKAETQATVATAETSTTKPSLAVTVDASLLARLVTMDQPAAIEQQLIDERDQS